MTHLHLRPFGLPGLIPCLLVMLALYARPLLAVEITPGQI
jgi:hypothetical protein